MMMTSPLVLLLAVVVVACMLQDNNVTAFAPLPVSSTAATRVPTTSATQLHFFGGKPKDDGTPGDYVCKDCGYVFTKGPKAWAALDDKTYACPPCGAPKFRFNKVPKGSAKGQPVKVKKSWF